MEGVRWGSTPQWKRTFHPLTRPLTFKQKGASGNGGIGKLERKVETEIGSGNGELFKVSPVYGKECDNGPYHSDVINFKMFASGVS